MTQCEYCKEYLWNEGQTSCSGGQCSTAYEMAMEDGVLDDEEDETTHKVKIRIVMGIPKKWRDNMKRFLESHKETIKSVIIGVVVLGLAFTGMKLSADKKEQDEYAITQTCHLCGNDIAKDTEKYIQFDGRNYHAQCFQNGLNGIKLDWGGILDE